jgi:DNA-binding NarL/FixJ family response regulator
MPTVTTILIVDDHPSFRACARLLLEAEGYEVVGEAATAAEALARAGTLRPDVVLLDVQLPDGDGFALAGQLAGNGGAPRVVIVSSRDGYESLAADSGAAGFIAKGELTGPALKALLV